MCCLRSGEKNVYLRTDFMENFDCKILQILKIRSQTEGIQVDDESLKTLAGIGVKSTLRWDKVARSCVWLTGECWTQTDFVLCVWRSRWVQGGKEGGALERSASVNQILQETAWLALCSSWWWSWFRILIRSPLHPLSKLIQCRSFKIFTTASVEKLGHQPQRERIHRVIFLVLDRQVFLVC